MTKSLKYMAAALMLAAGFSAAHAAPLNEMLPEDTLAFVEITPQSPTAVGGHGGLLDFSIQTLSALGAVPEDAAVVADFLRLGSQLGQRRNCLAWLDADFIVNYDTGVLGCRSLQFAWVLDVNGNTKPVLNQLAAVLRNYSTQKTSRQTVRTSSEGSRTYVEFHDTRWPEWQKIYWTQYGSCFVITLGQGSMEHFLNGASVGGVPWKDMLTHADTQAAAKGFHGQVIMRSFVHTSSLRERWPDVMSMTVASRLLAVYKGQKNEAAIVTARADDRLVQIDAATIEDGQMTTTPWTLTPDESSRQTRLVPPEAQYYMVLDMNWPVVYERLVTSLDLITGDKRPLADQVRLFPKLYKVDLQQDILEKLARPVLIHDAPQHPLRLPLMITGVVAAKQGKETEVQSAMDVLIKRGQATLDERAGITPATAAPGDTATVVQSDVRTFLSPLIRTSPEGITHIRFGLLGPGWIWQDRRLVFSWSPAAVKAYLPMVKANPAE